MTQATRRKAAGALLAAGVVGWMATALLAADDATPDATFTILGIHATKQTKPHVDPELAPLKDALARSGYNSFRLVFRDRRAVPYGKSWESRLIGNYGLRVTPQEAGKDRVKLTITWVRYEKDKEGRDVTRVLQRLPLTIRKAKYFLSGGWRLKDGAVLGAIAAE